LLLKTFLKTEVVWIYSSCIGCIGCQTMIVSQCMQIDLRMKQ